MEQTQYKTRTINEVIRWITSALGTFLFVFLMMHTIMIGVMGINNYRWWLPYFSLPAYVACFTVGAKYWVSGDPIRRRSYWISTIISAIVILPQTAFLIPSYVSMPLLRTIVSVLLAILLILYSILKVRTEKPTKHQIGVNNNTMHERRERIKLRQAIWIICLLSICCVLFENWQGSFVTAYGLIIKLKLAKSVLTFAPFPLSILSAILLARFVKAEFIPHSLSVD